MKRAKKDFENCENPSKKLKTLSKGSSYFIKCYERINIVSFGSKQ
jgi:hypothetical protein